MEQVSPNARIRVQLLIASPYYRAIPYVLITNGGGVPDEDRRRALSSELGHEVSSIMSWTGHSE